MAHDAARLPCVDRCPFILFELQPRRGLLMLLPSPRRSKHAKHVRHAAHSSRILRLLLCCLVSLMVQAAVFVVLPRITHSSLPVARAASGLNAIQIENTYPGDPTWNNFTANLDQHALSGYGSQISVDRGQSIDFYVTTNAPSFTIDIYRTGWYSGVGARHILSMGSFPGVQ